MILAKSSPPESLYEHTERLLENYRILKEMYSLEINKIFKGEEKIFWDLLYVACLYHDFGKVYTPFQNELRKKLGENLLITDFENDIPHGYLSPAFLDYRKLKEYGELYKVLLQAIIYHHERDIEINEEKIEKIFDIIDKDLTMWLYKLNEEMGLSISILNKKYVKYLKPEYRIKSNDSVYYFYVLLKGLLHRIDHAASAHIEVEKYSDEKLDQKVESYIKNELKSQLRDIQNFTKQHTDNNLVIIASTGIGKTEAALMWLSNNKGFFALPLRVTLNAMFSRIKDNIRFENIGLLHSTSLDYLESQGYEDAFETYEYSRQLSYRLNLTTIDQIFTFPFKFKGYEKVYSTLGYSKTIIDEIQAYSPRIAAIILKGLEMIYKIGGKFMIMTATLPRIYLDYLQEKNIPFEIDKFILNQNRHMIEIKDVEISDEIDEIINKGNSKKVLVITNTIKKSVEIYKKIKQRGIENVNLLHSMFIQKDKKIKESEIMKFSKSQSHGIWITTQIVEASLDIDFDFLFTELSTLDSLFQRMGRCYRKREFDLNEPNIIIYHKNASGIGSVYDKDIFILSLDALWEYNLKIIKEEDKIRLVDKIYSKDFLEGTSYYKEFIKALEVIESIIDYDVNKNEAQKILREINSLQVIPYEVFYENQDLYNKFLVASDKDEKRKLYRAIENLTVDLPFFRAKNKVSEINGLKGILKLESKYDSEIGVYLDEEITNIIG